MKQIISQLGMHGGVVKIQGFPRVPKTM
jgi:hypothetical protein